MFNDLLRLVNAYKWTNVSGGGAVRKEEILLKMRELINKELKKVRAEIKAEIGGE